MTAGFLLLVARLLLSAMFLASGFSVLSNVEGAAGYFAGLGLAAPLLVAWASGLFESVAALLLVVGFQTRPVSLLLAVFALAATFIGHYGRGGGDPVLAFMHSQALLKDIAVAGGLMALAVQGPGRFSADAWLGRFSSAASPQRP